MNSRTLSEIQELIKRSHPETGDATVLEKIRGFHFRTAGSDWARYAN